MRFGPDEIRQFYELWSRGDCERQQSFRRNLKAIEFGVGREAATLDAAQPPIDPTTYLSHPDLAKKYGKDPEKLRKRLERWRPKNRRDWKEIEASERGSTDPQYLYREVAAKSVIDQMQ